MQLQHGCHSQQWMCYLARHLQTGIDCLLTSPSEVYPKVENAVCLRLLLEAVYVVTVEVRYNSMHEHAQHAQLPAPKYWWQNGEFTKLTRPAAYSGPSMTPGVTGLLLRHSY